MKKIGKNTKLYLIGMVIGGITLGITTVIADTIINSTSVAYKTTTVKAALDELYDIADFKQEVKDMLYPVGSIYISVSSTNPSELFGGTWVSFGMGRTLVGLGLGESNTTDFYGSGPTGAWGIGSSVEEKGGEIYHTLTVNEMPAHSHESRFRYVNSNTYPFSLPQWSIYVTGVSTNNVIWEATTAGAGTFRYLSWGPSESTGGSSDHNNIQPYITVYMWKRTA